MIEIKQLPSYLTFQTKHDNKVVDLVVNNQFHYYRRLTAGGRSTFYIIPPRDFLIYLDGLDIPFYFAQDIYKLNPRYIFCRFTKEGDKQIFEGTKEDEGKYHFRHQDLYRKRYLMKQLISS